MTGFSEFVAAVHNRAQGKIKGSARLVLDSGHAVMLSHDGAKPCDEDTAADVAMIAPKEIFEAILNGTQSPIMAFMSGKLKVDGNPQRALKVASLLTA